MIEALISFVILLLLVVAVSSLVILWGKLFNSLSQKIEEEENLLGSINTLFQLVRYSDNLQSYSNGRKLTMTLSSNPLEIYSQGGTLLLKNKGVSNPIAEGCSEARFIVEGSEEKPFMRAHLVFGKEGVDIQINPCLLLSP
ncbi:MAG TPA: hypothetical protein PK016_00470 [Candidatus Atribacteria bacterium]|nr:hypothetical protein [Candidatus Atribacteria bacterium]